MALLCKLYLLNLKQIIWKWMEFINNNKQIYTWISSYVIRSSFPYYSIIIIFLTNKEIVKNTVH